MIDEVIFVFRGFGQRITFADADPVKYRLAVIVGGYVRVQVGFVELPNNFSAFCRSVNAPTWMVKLPLS